MSKIEPIHAANLTSSLTRFWYERDSSASDPAFIPALVVDMLRAARSARDWETRICNEPMGDITRARGDYRIKRLQDGINARLIDLFPSRTPRCELGGDPRGPCGVLVLPMGEYRDVELSL